MELPRSSRKPRPQRADGSALQSGPLRNSMSDVERGQAPRSRDGSADATCQTFERPKQHPPPETIPAVRSSVDLFICGEKRRKRGTWRYFYGNRRFCVFDRQPEPSGRGNVFRVYGLNLANMYRFVVLSQQMLFQLEDSRFWLYSPYSKYQVFRVIA
jgi:hypothetical protein